jgi:hypothetical protein
MSGRSTVGGKGVREERKGEGQENIHQLVTPAEF